MADIPQSALARSVSHEREREWPAMMELVATFHKKGPAGQIATTQVQAITITKEQFFGLGDHGAPITGEWLVAAVDRLRKARS